MSTRAQALSIGRTPALWIGLPDKLRRGSLLGDFLEVLQGLAVCQGVRGSLNWQASFKVVGGGGRDLGFGILFLV